MLPKKKEALHRYTVRARETHEWEERREFPVKFNWSLYLCE